MSWWHPPGMCGEDEGIFRGCLIYFRRLRFVCQWRNWSEDALGINEEIYMYVSRGNEVKRWKCCSCFNVIFGFRRCSCLQQQFTLKKSRTFSSIHFPLWHILNLSTSVLIHLQFLSSTGMQSKISLLNFINHPPKYPRFLWYVPRGRCPWRHFLFFCIYYI